MAKIHVNYHDGRSVEYDDIQLAGEAKYMSASDSYVAFQNSTHGYLVPLEGVKEVVVERDLEAEKAYNETAEKERKEYEDSLQAVFRPLADRIDG